MAFDTNSFMGIARDFTFKLWASKETALLQQIKDLVDRNILVVEEEEPVIVRDTGSGDYSIKQVVKLTVKDMEYIKALEAKVDRLKRALDCLVDKPATTSPDEEGFVSYKELLK